MSVIKMFKKLFTRYTDDKVEEINKQSIAKIEDAGRVALRHTELLKKNGIAYRIVIATGGDKHE